MHLKRVALGNLNALTWWPQASLKAQRLFSRPSAYDFRQEQKSDGMENIPPSWIISQMKTIIKGRNWLSSLAFKMSLNSERSMYGAPAQTCNLWRRQMDAFVDNDNVEFVISSTWNFFGYTVSPHPSLGVLFFLFHFIHSPPPSNLYQGKENILFSLPSYTKMSVWEITFQFIKHWIISDQYCLFLYLPAPILDVACRT